MPVYVEVWCEKDALAGVLMEETTRTLFCGDLFTQGGALSPPLTEADILGPSESFRGAMDYFAHAPGTAQQIERLASAGPTTLACMRELGATIDLRDGLVVVQGRGMNGLQKPAAALDAGNSGSTIRMLSGILAAQPFSTTIGGDESLSRRPMQRIMAPLAQMGARIDARENRFPPLNIHGVEPGAGLHPIEYSLPVASAQVKSCVLLAGLYAQGKTTVHEPLRTRDHTELALREFGAEVEVDRLSITVTGPARLQGRELYVPGDLSSAAVVVHHRPQRLPQGTRHATTSGSVCRSLPARRCQFAGS